MRSALACLLPHPPRHVDLPGIRRAYRAHAATSSCRLRPAGAGPRERGRRVPGALTDDLDTAKFKGRRPRALLDVWELAEVLGALPLPALGLVARDADLVRGGAVLAEVVEGAVQRVLDLPAGVQLAPAELHRVLIQALRAAIGTALDAVLDLAVRALAGLVELELSAELSRVPEVPVAVGAVIAQDALPELVADVVLQHAVPVVQHEALQAGPALLPAAVADRAVGLFPALAGRGLVSCAGLAVGPVDRVCRADLAVRALAHVG
uniref:Uncharacterized protein n=1 Tax=Spironucleus salmonicida TaxID=348837 RepID=V6LHR5_9EUKA|eukprot:EST44115.1 Hypothetical protein SS50377_16115 [Spironucleus salmonicida]